MIKPLSCHFIKTIKEAENGWLLAAAPREFHPAHADGCAAQCFEGVQRGSLIVLSVHLRPQVATPVSRPGFVARLFGRGPVLRTCNRVMAHRPIGSTQTDRIRLPYAARRLSLSRNNKALSACKNIPFPICFYGTTNSP